MKDECETCAYEKLLHKNTRSEINKDKVEPSFESQRADYFLGEFVDKFWEEALRAMTQQIDNGYSDMGTKSTTVTSPVADSKTADVTNTKEAEIAIETAPSEAMCERVTLSEGVAATANNVVIATDTLNESGAATLAGAAGTPGAAGPATERQINLDTIIQTNMNPNDLGGVVGEATGFSPADGSRINADLDAPFLEQYTFDIDYRDGTSNPVEEDLDMLRYNLYGGAISRLRAIDQGSRGFDDAIAARYQVIALKSLAQGSFNTLVSLHHPGVEGSGQYYRALLESRGVTDETMVKSLLGENDAPSLLAQAKILALYTNATPEVATDTIATSADTRRLAIAQQAAKLMIKYEVYKSLQRSALSWTMLHELKIRPYQRAYEGQIGSDPLGENDDI